MYFDEKENLMDCKTLEGHLKFGHLYHKSSYYILRRQYAYTEKHEQKMRRTITCFIDNDGNEYNHYTVNYKVTNSGNRNTSFSRAHGNAKDKHETYIRTKPSI